MADIGTPKPELAKEHIELRILQLTAQLKARDIKIMELLIQVEKEKKGIEELNKEMDKTKKELSTYE